MEKNTQQKNIALKDTDNWSNPIFLITDAESSPQFKNGVIAYQEGDYQEASREFKAVLLASIPRASHVHS